MGNSNNNSEIKRVSNKYFKRIRGKKHNQLFLKYRMNKYRLNDIKTAAYISQIEINNEHNLRVN